MKYHSSGTTRRGFLAGATGLVGSLAVGCERVAAQSTTKKPAFIPESPYIVPAHGAPLFRGQPNLGWPAFDKKERIKLIRGLHPDLADFRRLVWIENMEDNLPPGADQQGEFSMREGVPGTSGQTIYVSSNPERAEKHWGYLRQMNNWTYPDGTPVENPTELFAERFNGKKHTFGVQQSGIGIPSVFAPGTLDIVAMGGKKAFSEGFSGMFLDSTTTPRVKGLDFSPWAQASFRTHLGELSDERLSELDIEHPMSVDIRSAFESRGIHPARDTHPATDPLYREYLLFHHRGLQAFLEAYKERMRSAYPDRDPRTLQLYGNQYIGDELAAQPAASIHISESLDFVNIEDNRTLPPEYIREPVYKLIHAAAKDQKPVLVEGQMHDQPGQAQTLRGLDPTERYHTLQRLQLAEAYANGVPRKLPLTSWGNIHADDTAAHWVRKDGTIPEELQTFADFLWVNRRFLEGATPDNDVAVVFSVPTHLWETAPQWRRRSKRHSDAFRGVARLLHDAQIPYDVKIFGHDSLYDDQPHLESLTDYDAVILPGISSIADRQLDSLQTALNNGGTIITTARVPDRDEDFRERDARLLEGSDVTNLTDEPGLTRVREGTTEGSLSSALAGVKSVTLKDAPAVGVNRLRNDDPETLQIHLVNYNYNQGSDAVDTLTDLELSVSEIGFEPVTAAYVTPSATSKLEIDSSDTGVSVTVPRLSEWGFVVLAASREGVESPGDKSRARSLVDKLDARTQRARERLGVPSVSLGLARAEVFLSEAHTAMDAESYAQAEVRAKAGLSALEALSVSVTTTTQTSATTGRETSSDSGASTTETFGSTTETNGGMPGFGVLQGVVASAAGTAVALLRHLNEDE